MATRLHHLLAGTAILFLLPDAPAPGQSTGTAEFEVASIKPAAPLDTMQLVMGRQRAGVRTDSARVDIANLSLADLIRTAFRVKPYQIAGPDWIRQHRFDILGKLPEGASADQLPEMLQDLLAKRFRLTLHRETKEHAVYALVVGKNGPKLVEAGAAPPADPPASATEGHAADSMQVSADAASLLVAGERTGLIRVSAGAGGAMRLEAREATLAALAEMLSRILDRPVMDMTGLTGVYQLSLNLSMQDMHSMVEAAGMMPPGGATAADTTSALEAVQEPGLRLEPRKAPMEMIVIDHLERTPTEN